MFQSMRNINWNVSKVLRSRLTVTCSVVDTVVWWTAAVVTANFTPLTPVNQTSKVYFRRVKQGENRLLGRIMVNAQRRGSEWMKEMRRHMDSGLGWCQGRGFGSNDEGTGEEENSRGGTSGVEE